MKSTSFDLSGKVALVTGGATGIGYAVTEGFVEHGAQVLIGSRSLETINQAVQRLNGQGSEEQVAGTQLDVTSEDSVQAAVALAVQSFGRLDILVNCAGIPLRKPLLELEAEEFNHIHNIHATGALRCAQAAARTFIPQGGGCIVLIASLTSFVDSLEVAAYAAAKSAVLGLTRSCANEWAKYGIRTNAIAPGVVVTDLNRKEIENNDRGRRIIERTPAGRFGKPEEISGTAVYLASDAAAFVNGQTVVVDGGFLACGFGDSRASFG